MKGNKQGLNKFCSICTGMACLFLRPPTHSTWIQGALSRSTEHNRICHIVADFYRRATFISIYECASAEDNLTRSHPHLEEWHFHFSPTGLRNFPSSHARLSVSRQKHLIYFLPFLYLSLMLCFVYCATALLLPVTIDRHKGWHHEQ